MNLRKTFPFVIIGGLLLMSAYNVNAQNWAPEGASWHYNETYAFYPDSTYIKYESVGDTVIDGQACKKLDKYHYVYYLMRDHDEEYMFSRNDTVFVYDNYIEDFQMLYDFNAEAGDTWYRLIPDAYDDTDTSFVHIDSTTTTEINGVTLEKFYATFEMVYHSDNFDDWTYNGEIIERIGYMDYMFYSTPVTYFTYDHNFATGLRCYEDDILGLYETGMVDSCTYTYYWEPTRTNFAKTSNIRTYPNPVKKLLNIDTEIKGEITFSLRSLTGKIVEKGSINENGAINVSTLNKGLYILFINRNDQIIHRKKIIKL
ncbi:MAG: T9SS type A sorting domain-containing protein [Bacteroidales bacterium]|nr:T9SS type A sorting domain-containing protein [Bacteroidales bacterium]MCF8338514.1 T9SS type A sorting domain-containing protein [Bacteroidales bacterium]